MMGRSLLVLGGLATAGLVASAISGYAVDESWTSFELHLSVALVAFLLLVFSHCWIFVYLAAIVRALNAVAWDNGLGAEAIEESRAHRARCTAWPSFAALLALATFLLGARAFTEGTSSALHHAAFYITLPVQVVALLVERRALAASQLLILAVDQRLAGGD